MATTLRLQLEEAQAEIAELSEAYESLMAENRRLFEVLEQFSELADEVDDLLRGVDDDLPFNGKRLLAT